MHHLSVREKPRSMRTGLPGSILHRSELLVLPIATGYLWVMMILFGAIVMETFMLYPNVFSDPPDSLELSMEFLAVRGPSDFFPPLGLLSWVLGAASLVLNAVAAVTAFIGFLRLYRQRVLSASSETITH